MISYLKLLNKYIIQLCFYCDKPVFFKYILTLMQIPISQILSLSVLTLIIKCF